MCDLSDEHDVQNVTGWIQEIIERHTVDNFVIMVLANKCDLLDNIDQSIVLNLEDELEESYPFVIYREISVLFNIDLQKSMAELADQMQRYRSSFAQ